MFFVWLLLFGLGKAASVVNPLQFPYLGSSEIFFWLLFHMIITATGDVYLENTCIRVSETVNALFKYSYVTRILMHLYCTQNMLNIY